MSYLRRFGHFWWSFVVGDDLPLAVGAGATIGLTALLVEQGVDAWWFLPTAILALLAISVARAADPDNPWHAFPRRRKTRAMKQAAEGAGAAQDRRVRSDA